MIPVTVVSTFVGSKAYTDLKKAGTALLGKLTGCKIKPKGTPHAEIWRKAPKLFITYGDGIPGSPTFRPSSKTQGGYFDPLSGLWLRDYETTFPRDERKSIEATFRQPCESVTGDTQYYAEVRPPAEDRGLVRLNDGNIYQAAFYGVEGGTYASPVNVNAKPLGSSDVSGLPKDTGSKMSMATLPIFPLAIVGYFLMKGK